MPLLSGRTQTSALAVARVSGIATFSAVGLVVLNPGLITGLALVPFAALFGLAGCGWIASRTGFRLPGAGTAFTFVLANAAFLIGVWRATLGDRIHSYRNVAR